MVDDIKEDDFDVDKGGQVEIIGWLYQYYNIEPHDKVVNINGGPIKTNDIPAATQLFTTDWVVRYMVDNSLGRLYLEYFPDSPIKANLTYLLPGPIEKRTDSFDLSKLKMLDDAMGSGHILVYAFDLLIQMYEEQGYGKRDATDAILAHNLYGLEIDKRAYQLAYFALMMKARQYNRRILSKPTRHNLHVFESTVDLPNEVFEKMKASKDTIDDLRTLVSTFKKAKLLGSIMHFEKKFDFDALFSAVNSLPDSTQLDLFGLQAAKNSLLGILKITQVLQTHFDVVATNPPYLNRMNGDLKKYVKKYYKAYSGDLFSVFIWKNIEMTKQDGYSAYMTPFVWMFIKTYEGLRKSILDSKQISSLIQMEYSAFEEATVPINTFVLKNDMSADSTGTYLKLSDFKGGMEVQRRYVLKAVADPSVSYLYRTKQTNFEKIPGNSIGYWLSEEFVNSFMHSKLTDFSFAGTGMRTGDNDRFLRRWFEVCADDTKFENAKISDTYSGIKWIPYSKGGSFRRWYGNQDYVVNWENNGQEIKDNTRKHYPELGENLSWKITNEPKFFHEAITWSSLTSGTTSFRHNPQGYIFDTKGPIIIPTKISLEYLEAYLNSVVCSKYLSVLAPTLDVNPSVFTKMPLIDPNTAEGTLIGHIEDLVMSSELLSKHEWNSFEYSWFFKSHPLCKNIADHQKSPTTKLLIFFEFCDKYVPIQFRGLIFFGQLSKKR
ncbi:BREX-1 system adenine-specific DNA-methyltransferase PglX [Lacticaseibacillus paracasei]|uniref:BREX-1 system adenine-specific DNA-methyltransferase PglX n=1 Tax=Lacticaseibacillus paracasei TaxID=1597 RepID=UPI0037095512